MEEYTIEQLEIQELERNLSDMEDRVAELKRTLALKVMSKIDQ